MKRRYRIAAALAVLVVELLLYFGTGIMLEKETDFLSGEGSWEEPFEETQNSYTQCFKPKHRNLESISFLVNMTDVTERDGTVTVRLADRTGQVLFEKTLSYMEVSNGSYTDVEIGQTLSLNQKYDLILTAEPSSVGEYLTVSVCDTSWRLPESRGLKRGDEKLSSIQLVTRYVYSDALSDRKLWIILCICVLTAVGIAVGLPTQNKYVYGMVSVALMALVPVVLGIQMERLTFEEVYRLPITMRFRTMERLPFALLWNLAIMCVVELVIFLCSHSVRVSVILTDLLITLVYSVNYFVIAYRGTPLRVSDLSAAGTAVKVVGEYSLAPNSALAIEWGCALLFIVYGAQAIHLKRTMNRRRALTYGVTILATVCIVAAGGQQLLYTDLLERVGFANDEFKGFYQDMLYYLDGYLVATCLEVKNARSVPPEDYSGERVAEILSKAQDREAGRGDSLTEEEQADLPHVILIMNESFADLRVLADLELSSDNLEFFNSLKENTVRGYVNASVIGGGTANSEFEVFTGCTMAFFPVNYYPYQQAVKKPVHTLVSTMQSYGYTAVSMHPEAEGNWNRTNVYRYFGFDKSLWKQDFEGAEIVHAGVSDAETFHKVEELYESRQPGEKLFVFDLTMQNHGGYHGKETPFATRETHINNPILDEYLSLIKKSDDAFADLVHYFENADEKVVICMYGDHQPWVSDLIMEAYHTSNASEPLALMNKYKTPFVIWANYDIEEAEGYDISMNYLGGLVQRTAGIPLTPYFSFLEAQRQAYPIITVNGYVDADGNYHNWNGDEEFTEYRMLQYNYLYDDNTVEWGF